MSKDIDATAPMTGPAAGAGKWLLSRHNELAPAIAYVITDGEGDPCISSREVAVVYRAEEGSIGEERARLIAAAPDLLEACRKAHDVLYGLQFTDYPCSKELEAVAAAIAKATGGAA